MPSNFTKQPQFLDFKFLNAAVGDSVQGGLLTAIPTPLAIPGYIQGMQTIAGDRIVLGALDAFALSNTAIGTLYSGIYMYVNSLATGGTPAIGKLAFWDPAAFSIATTTAPNSFDNLYRTTAAELQAGVGQTPPIAGVYINTLTAGNLWWIQIAGKATMSFGPAAGSQFGGTSTYAKNFGVYAGGYGTTAGSGFVTQISGTTFATTSATLDPFINQYLGTAESTPAASTLGIVDMNPKLYRL